MSELRTLILDSLFGSPVGMTLPVSGPYRPDLFLDPERQDSSEPSGRFVLSYFMDDDRMVYGSYSRGYRSGAFNGVHFFSPDELNYQGPEIVDSYELGSKLAFSGRRLQLNSALFNTDIRNQQVLTQVNVPPCTTCNPPTPGASFSGLGGLDGWVRGLEVSVTALIGDNLRGRVAATLLDSEYDGGQVVNGVDIEGNEFPFAPEVSWLAGLEWTVWQQGDRTLSLEGNVIYKGEHEANPENGQNAVGPIAEGIPSYYLVDAQLRFEVGRYRMSVWGKNLTDEAYFKWMADTEASFGGNNAFRGAPRSAGVSFRADF